MGEKSHVGMECHQYPITGEIHAIGVLLDRKLRNSLERETVTGISLCPEMKEKFDEGYVALIEVDISKSTEPLSPSTAHKTGPLAHIRRTVFPEIFKGMEINETTEFVYVEKGVIQQLAELPQEG